MGLANDIWVAYIGYLLYRPLFQMLITIASFEIARYGNNSCGVLLNQGFKIQHTKSDVF